MDEKDKELEALEGAANAARSLNDTELAELHEEASRKYDHPTKPIPMTLNPRGVLALTNEVMAARAWRKEAAALIKEAADWTGRPGLAARLYAFLEWSAAQPAP